MSFVRRVAPGDVCRAACLHSCGFEKLHLVRLPRKNHAMCQLPTRDAPNVILLPARATLQSESHNRDPTAIKRHYVHNPGRWTKRCVVHPSALLFVVPYRYLSRDGPQGGRTAMKVISTGVMAGGRGCPRFRSRLSHPLCTTVNHIAARISSFHVWPAGQRPGST